MAYVACGYRHTLAISDEGALFAFGWNACVASLRTRNRPHHATDTVQHATELDASCNSVVAALFAFGSHCRSALRHCGTAARLCNAVSTHGPELSMRQSTKHFLASAFVCAQLRATRHQRKYGFDSLSMMRKGTIGSCTRTAVMRRVVAIVCVWAASSSCAHEQRPWLMRAQMRCHSMAE